MVQFYLNRTLPPELLAASDSALETANCGTVGLIASIFLGRINMRFWTQLCSEWSCIPNAFADVSLSATHALPEIYPSEYADSSTAFKYICIIRCINSIISINFWVGSI